MWRGRAAAPVHLGMVPEVGPGREAAVALRAGEWPLLGVDAAVTHQLGGHPEGLATVGALVALGLCVDAPMVLERHEVGELLAAGAAEVRARLVAVAVVEQRAGMAVRPPALVTHMGSEGLAATAAPAGAAGSGYAAAPGVESLLLHQCKVQS